METSSATDALIGSQAQHKKKRKHSLIFSILVVIVLLGVGIGLLVYFIQRDESKKRNRNQAWSPPHPCDPLVNDICYLPFPNDYWLSKNKYGTPKKLAFSSKTLPITDLNESIEPYYWNKMDGFSPLPCLQTYFVNLSLDHSNVARLWNISQSTADMNDTPIIIIEADTLRIIPYWVEVDYSSDLNAGNETIIDTNPEYQRVLMVWPAQRLNDGKRYIIAMRNLKDFENQTLNASDAFIHLRDNIKSEQDSIELRRDYFNENIFSILTENTNFQRSSLQIAWDFTVASGKMMRSLMTNMKKDALDRLKMDDDDSETYFVDYNILEITQNPYPNIARLVTGTMMVPWYLNKYEAGVDVRVVVSDERGDRIHPLFQSFANVTFGMIIPDSIANHSIASPKWIQYGHGLFGSHVQVYTTEWRRDMFNDFGYIGIAVDLLGMSSKDEMFAAQVLSTDLTDFVMIPERLHQGMLNHLVLNKLMKDSIFLNDLSVFGFENDFNETEFVDINEDTPQFFYGISQGGIMGNVYLALSDDINQAVLDVPGFPYELILPRSVDYAPFWNIKKARFAKETDRIFLISLQQLLWNRLSPNGYINQMKENPNNSVLIHYAMADAEVSWLGAYQMARTLDCVMYQSQITERNESIYGIEMVSDDMEFDLNDNGLNATNAFCKIQGWHFEGYPNAPFVNLPPLGGEYNTHGLMSRLPSAIDALDLFFSDKRIINTCQGSCNINSTS